MNFGVVTVGAPPFTESDFCFKWHLKCQLLSTEMFLETFNFSTWYIFKQKCLSAVGTLKKSLPVFRKFKKYFELSCESLFFQLSEFFSWWMFPNAYDCWWENPDSWLHRKWPFCLCDFGLPVARAADSLCSITCGCIPLTFRVFVEYYSVCQHCKCCSITQTFR